MDTQVGAEEVNHRLIRRFLPREASFACSNWMLGISISHYLPVTVAAAVQA